MNEVSIRIAGLQDAELVADMSRETFYQAFAPGNTKADMDKFMNEVFTREKLISEFSLPNNIFLIAYANNEPAGYVRMRDCSLPETPLNSNNIIEIARIYTATNKIGKGIGAELIKKCILIAQEKQRDFIWLGVWEKNIKALRFMKNMASKNLVTTCLF